MIDLRLGDCFEEIKKIKDESIDCVIIDPPYFLEGMGDSWNTEQLYMETEKGTVIRSMPVGMKFDVQQGKDFEKFMFSISSEIYRVLKKGGFYLSFSQPRLYHRMAVAVEDCGFEIRDSIIWVRDGQSKAFSQEHFVKKMDISEEEKQTIINLLNGRKTPQLTPMHEDIVLAQKPKDGTFVENWIKHGVGLIDITQTVNGKLPSNIMCVEKPKGQEKTVHLTQKPVLLIEKLIKIFTKQGDTVLDCFMGSGTTGIACINSKRNFIGIEKDEMYYSISKERVFKAQRQETLFDYLQGGMTNEHF